MVKFIEECCSMIKVKELKKYPLLKVDSEIIVGSEQNRTNLFFIIWRLVEYINFFKLDIQQTKNKSRINILG